MPRKPKDKKRRSPVKNVPRKRLKFDKSQTAAAESTNGDGSSEDIDKILEENASKNNLTTINIKSIIHHVVSDKRVLALVQNAMEEGEDKTELTTSKTDPPVVSPDFEPKMTRSKLKQTAHGDPIAALMSNSPLKKHDRSPFKMSNSTLKKNDRSPFKKFHFTDLKFPDSSSDEEYNPTLEERVSDDDGESFVSHESDMASPRRVDTAQPKEQQQAAAACDGNDIQLQTVVTRSVQRKAGADLMFKVPHDVADSTVTKELSELVEVSEIARRTRSQLPLKDTTLESLEASFQPPDLTPDLYDILPIEEMDYDDIEWQRWLQGLVCASNDGQTEEDNDDTEYNFMAEDQKEEMEEYRNDRAVRIPQKEVTELIDELLRDYEVPDDDLGGDGPFDSCTWPTSLVAAVFMPWQREQLTEQLEQHTQLLTQLYLMCREEPTLQSEAETCHKYVTEMDGFSDRASNVNLIRALGDGHVESSAFCFPGLDEAVKIVNSKCTVKKLSYTLRKSSNDSIMAAKKRHYKKTPESFLPPLTQTNKEIMATSSVFKYIELLPHFTLLSKTTIQETLGSGGLRTTFTEAEDNLLVLGLAQFEKDFELIHTHLLPNKSSKQLQIRCKNKSASRAQENVIKHYRNTKELWPMPRDISNSSSLEISGHHLSRLRGKAVRPPVWLREYKERHKQRTATCAPTLQTSKEKYPRRGTGVKPILPASEKPKAIVAAGNNGDGRTTQEIDRPTERVNKDVGDNSVVLLVLQHKSCPPQLGAAVSEGSEMQVTKIHITKDSSLPRDSGITDKKAEDTGSRSEPGVDVRVDLDIGQSNDPSEHLHDTDSIMSGVEKETTGNTTNSREVQPRDKTEEKTAIKPGSDVTLCDQASINGKSNSAAALKGKSRDKGVDKPCGRVTSRAQGISSETVNSCVLKKSAVASQSAPVNYVLEPDPKAKERATAFAENYMAKVKKELRSSPDLLEEFLQILALSSSEGWSQVQLYKRISVVLADYPDLVEEFVAFLDPDQAIEAGVFMTNLEFSRAKTFLRKLEVHFQRNPAHFRKIVRVFNSHSKGEKTSSSQLHQTILPMLRGQQHLIDEFNSFFDDLRPPPYSDEDFEDVELGSGSEPESDDFEEVVIPDLCEPKKVKGRPSKPAIQTPVAKTTSSKAKQTRKAVLPGKTSGTTKNSRGQGTGDKVAPERRSKASRARSRQICDKKDSSSDTSKEISYPDAKGSEKRQDQTFPCRLTLSQSEKSPFEEEAFVEDAPSDSEAPYLVRLTLDDPLSSRQTETSNDSCQTDDSLSHPTPSGEPQRSLTTREPDRLCSASGQLGKRQDSEPEDDEADVDDVDSVSTNNDVTCDVESDTDMSVNQGSVMLANNVRLGRDGTPVVVWTREHDRVILRACQESGATADSFERIATDLGNKTSVQVEQRFLELVKLFTTSTKRREVKDSTHEDSSSGEDTRGSESENEPCSDH